MGNGTWNAQNKSAFGCCGHESERTAAAAYQQCGREKPALGQGRAESDRADDSTGNLCTGIPGWLRSKIIRLTVNHHGSANHI
ncbi:MAG: hypothetical protein VB071_04115 [Lawsonibacter sp.]|nr:hypothetical protein [Lawsonibacter sp.]